MTSKRPTTVGEARVKIAEIQSWLASLSDQLAKKSDAEPLEDQDCLRPADYAVIKSISLGRGC